MILKTLLNPLKTPRETGYVSIKRNGQEAIKCMTCNRMSFNQNDIVNLYCGFCHSFHELINEAYPVNALT